MKNRIAVIIAAIGGFCALCCVVPIAGSIGLGALEAFFCDSPLAIGTGVVLMAGGLGYLGSKYLKGFCSKPIEASNCAMGCNRKQS